MAGLYAKLEQLPPWAALGYAQGRAGTAARAAVEEQAEAEALFRGEEGACWISFRLSTQRAFRYM